MFLDGGRAARGVDPFWQFTGAGKNLCGSIGMEAFDYQKHLDYKELIKEPELVAGIAALHHADEAMCEAASLLTKTGGRFHVGPPREMPVRLERLTETEAAYLEHLARALVELQHADARFRAANEALGLQKADAFSAAQWLGTFQQSLTDLGKAAKARVEVLAGSMQPLEAGTAAAAAAPDFTAAAEYLESRFPGFSSGHYLDSARGISRMLQQGNRRPG